MALVPLRPDSEDPDLGAPPDYNAQHPGERPAMWGWHGTWGGAARVGGWVVVAILLLLITTTHYNESGTAWLIGLAAGLIVILVWDIQRRRNAWRR
jgi:hypothetical protein